MYEIRRYMNILSESVTEANDLVYDVKSGDVIAPSRENLSVREARKLLDANPMSIVRHPCMDELAWVARREDGTYVFWERQYHKNGEEWDWKQDIIDLEANASDSYDVYKDWIFEPVDEAFDYNPSVIEVFKRLTGKNDRPQLTDQS